MSSYSSYALGRLQSYVNALAYNPYGARLLSEANRRGIHIEYGQTPQGVLGYYDPQSNNIIMGDRTIQDPQLGISILAHEMVHGDTTQDGDSQHEEGTAFALGEYIKDQIYGQPVNSNYLNQLYYSTARLYPNLPVYNQGFNEDLNQVLRG